MLRQEVNRTVCLFSVDATSVVHVTNGRRVILYHIRKKLLIWSEFVPRWSVSDNQTIRMNNLHTTETDMTGPGEKRYDFRKYRFWKYNFGKFLPTLYWVNFRLACFRIKYGQRHCWLIKPKKEEFSTLLFFCDHNVYNCSQFLSASPKVKQAFHICMTSKDVRD